jgi:GNAT superfamily N-acetyltransferase
LRRLALNALPPIRRGRDEDGPGLIALVAACWSQYPGIVLDVDAEMPEFHALASYYRGALWVAEEHGQPVGMIATRPEPESAASWEICRVYVHPTWHGSGLGHALLDIAEAHAITGGAQRLFLWSDTRFERAHRFYEKRAYQRMGATRALDDLSHSHEFCFVKAWALPRTR